MYIIYIMSLYIFYYSFVIKEIYELHTLHITLAIDDYVFYAFILLTRAAVSIRVLEIGV